MPDITRRDPFTDLSQTMDRLFDGGVSRPWRLMQGIDDIEVPPIEVSEVEDAIEVKASMPGVKPEDIDISVHGDMLTIKAESREEQEDKQRDYYRRELHYGSMQRSINLPGMVDTGRSEARYEDGILKVRLPKTEEARPKQISVKSA